MTLHLTNIKYKGIAKADKTFCDSFIKSKSSGAKLSVSFRKKI